MSQSKTFNIIPQQLRPLVYALFIVVNLLGTLFAAESSGDSDSVNNSIYPASFYDQYLPQNAKEMIDRTPGFKFDAGSNDRGFGGNAGNVLIDGARPTSKSGRLDQVLTKIPASQVVRIELIRGGVSSGEAAGQTIVANIVRAKVGTSGSWAFKQRLVSEGKSQPNLEAAISTKLGSWNSSFDIDIGAVPGHRSAGLTNVDSSNQLLWSADEIQIEKREFLFINGELSQQFDTGKLIITGRTGDGRFSQDTDRDIYNVQTVLDTEPDQFWQLENLSNFDIKEIGLDWSQKLTNWQWRLIGIGLIRNNDFESDLIVSGDEANNFSRTFKQESSNSEYIFRTTFNNNGSLDYSPEFGLEIARNKLTSKSVAIRDSVQQTLNGGDVVVEELRGEIFATFNYKATDNLTLEVGVTAEFSTIEVSGDASQKQSLSFIKPRFSAIYKINNAQQFNLELERLVGQLNFNDFAASSEASDNRTTSGNPDLLPDKTTELAITYDWSYSNRGSFKIKAFYQKREDILEQIILPSGGQGIGNAGDADFFGLDTNLNIPLDSILDNGLIEISHLYRSSTFFDPIIGKDRLISNHPESRLSFKLRQDLTQYKFAWGIEYWGKYREKGFFTDEIVTFSGNRRLRFFLETSQFWGVKTQLEVTHANTGNYVRTRYIYDTDRSGLISNIQTSNRLRKPEIKLTFSKNF